MYLVVIKEMMPITKVVGDVVYLEGYQVICENVFLASDVVLTETEARCLIDGSWKTVPLRQGIRVSVTSGG